ncbi:MAG: uracil-DNA glycosylase [Alphaproteobacteria bacterium]|nr:uracil-DNA glycosylase [Alphaproteobacteria bacterium]MDX5368773.1 uracil-DNA glycosylase [Alphaproteobacteria bacterium]MDX5463509.1 uracil-DNA glycosylase [Alphaproteobacteria bacterium]
MSHLPPEPPRDCALCPRLVAYRQENAAKEPGWFNGAVPSFAPPDGDAAVRLLIVGLAPGVTGANRTGRPFTGDYAGDLLYATLKAHGLAEGAYLQHPGDGLTLRGAMITNAVRCVPPQNKPTTAEIRTCARFLKARVDALPNLRVIVALGRIAHDAVLDVTAARRAAHPFAHGARHLLPSGHLLHDSYHCSRYNTNTRRLTPEMFDAVFQAVRADLSA